MYFGKEIFIYEENINWRSERYVKYVSPDEIERYFNENKEYFVDPSTSFQSFCFSQKEDKFFYELILFEYITSDTCIKYVLQPHTIYFYACGIT